MRSLLLLCLWLAVAACSSRAWAQPIARRAAEVTALVERVDDALARGRHAAALRTLEKAVARYRGEALLLARYAELTLPLAGTSVASARAGQAASSLLRQIERGQAVPGDKLATHDVESERQITLHAAIAEALLSRFAQALALAVEAGRLQDARTVACLRQIAALSVRAEALDVAEHALSFAVQYMPQDRELPAELGHVLLARGDGEAAIRVLSERLSTAPDSWLARIDLAYALAAQGRAGEGLALLRRDTTTCASELGCALSAARIALEAGRPQEAREFIAAWGARGELDALYVLADAALRTADFPAARAAYQQILTLRPGSVRAEQGLEQLPSSNSGGR